MGETITTSDPAEAERRAVLSLCNAADRLASLVCGGLPLPPGAAGVLEGTARSLGLIAEHMGATDDDGMTD